MWTVDRQTQLKYIHVSSDYVIIKSILELCISYELAYLGARLQAGVYFPSEAFCLHSVPVQWIQLKMPQYYLRPTASFHTLSNLLL